MSDVAIRVEGLGKRYRIGAQQQRHDTLRDAIVDGVSRLKVGRLKVSNLDNRNAQPSTPQPSTDFWALKDVSFEVKQGEVVGVIGRNGAGKSTLLKILSRITEPTEGRAEIHGRVGSLLEVGTGFHPELTGRENIFLNGAILGMRRTEIAARFDEIVAFSEIEKFLDTPVKRYSSGMYVRLAFAVAAHLEPEILLVDEVLAVGDAAFQKKCLGKMGDVAKEGRTVLFVSHNMVAVQTLCRRVFWVDTGQLKAQGEVNPIVSTYMRSGLTEDGTSERIWADVTNAPGNETVRLHRIVVHPEDGKAGDVITMQTPLQIEVEYWNLLPTVHLHVELYVTNEQGILAFKSSTGFDPDPVLHIQPSIGLFRSVCKIPGNLLNSGVHRISVHLVRGNMASTYRHDETVDFDVIDDHERKFSWYGNEPGVVSPRFAWETKHLDDAQSDLQMVTTRPNLPLGFR